MMLFPHSLSIPHHLVHHSLERPTPLLLTLFHTLSSEARFNITRMPSYHYLKIGKVMMAVCVVVADVTFLPNEANAIEFLNR